MPEPLETWIDHVREAGRRGELFTAFDLAERGLEEHPGSVLLQHGAVLALARAGSTGEARRRFDDYGLASVDGEDVRALDARIEKDLALAAEGPVRKRRAGAAAGLYRRIFEQTGGYYPGVNAATLMLVSGAVDDARAVAERVLAMLLKEDRDSYYPAASEAEALLVLGRDVEARAALERAAKAHGGDFGALSTTRRQLKLVCHTAGIDPDLLSAIAGPSVVHYCGHRIDPPGEGGRFPAAAEESVRAEIATAIARERPGFGYGSLASGADILWAEALLDCGAELHVVLPFDRDEFVRSSVADGGSDWVARFGRCLAGATAIRCATDDAYLGDTVLYRYGSELAMGLALLRARFLDAPARQLAIWDGQPAQGEAGTAIDVATWSRHGRPVTVVSPGAALPPDRVVHDAESSGRIVRAMLFSDVRGFSKLTDEQLPRFAEHVLGTLGVILDRHTASIACLETWGDGVYVVLDDVVGAAECALALQEGMAALDLAALGLPEHLTLRLGGHVGPVFPVVNPLTRTPSFMGTHVNRTARIEPITPPGAAFVTEEFAAALILANSGLACDYVGHIPAAKDYGRLRMYRLTRGTGSPTSAHPVRCREPTREAL